MKVRHLLFIFVYLLVVYLLVEIKLIDLHVLFVWKCGNLVCDTSITTSGRLSLPRIFLSCPSVRKKWQLSCDHPFEEIGSITLPEKLIALSVNPQYKSLVALSTG